MIDHERKLLFVHIPKSAGITINKALFNTEKKDRYLHIKPNHPHYKPYWNDYFTFTFVRNPFDKLVSGYLFTLRKEKDPAFYKGIKNYKNFEEFVLKVNKEKLITSLRFEPQINWIKDYKYDCLGRFENLQQDFYILCDRLNIPRIKLDKINDSKGRKNYKSYYTPETKKIVEELYKEDLEYFNYQF